MRESFRGWRRKIGVATLAMALATTAGWMRADKIVDAFNFGRRNGAVSYSLFSGPNGLTITKRIEDTGRTWAPQWNCYIAPPDSFFYFFEPGKTLEWRTGCAGLDFGEFHDLEVPHWRMAWGNFPYWSIVTPLTLLSAYLLLSRPLPRNSAEARKPTDEAKVTNA